MSAVVYRCPACDNTQIHRIEIVGYGADSQCARCDFRCTEAAFLAIGQKLNQAARDRRELELLRELFVAVKRGNPFGEITDIVKQIERLRAGKAA